MAETKTIGMRELKMNPGKVVRSARENNEVINLTFRGEIVARIVPVRSLKETSEPRRKSPEEIQAEMADYWRLFDELSKRISDSWPAGVSAADAITEDRRDL